MSATSHKPARRLKTALSRLDEVDYINAGGCGVSALAIYRWCKANNIQIEDRPFVFLWSSHDERDAERNDILLNEGKLNDVEVPAHVAVRLHDTEFDSEGDNAGESWSIHQTYLLNEAELLIVINESSGWNSLFRRRVHVPEIEQALGVDLSDVILTNR